MSLLSIFRKADYEEYPGEEELLREERFLKKKARKSYVSALRLIRKYPCGACNAIYLALGCYFNLDDLKGMRKCLRFIDEYSDGLDVSFMNYNAWLSTVLSGINERCFGERERRRQQALSRRVFSRS